MRQLNTNVARTRALPYGATSTPSSCSSRPRSWSNAGPAEHAGPRQVDGHVDRDAPVAQHERTVGEQDRLVDVVGDQQRRRAVAGAESPMSCCMRRRVSASSAANGSSRSSSCGIAHQRPGQRHPLRLTTGERRRPGVGVLGEADLGSAVARHALLPSVRAGSPARTLRHTRFDVTSRGSWNTTVRRSGTHTSPPSGVSMPARILQQRRLAAAARARAAPRTHRRRRRGRCRRARCDRGTLAATSARGRSSVGLRRSRVDRAHRLTLARHGIRHALEQRARARRRRGRARRRS